MPVSAQTPTITYTASGTATTFVYPYKILEEDDIKVYVNESLVGAGYTVTGVGVGSGGNVVFSAPPTVGSRVRLTRSIPRTRTTDYVEGGSLRASVLDDDIDRVVMMLQDIEAGTPVTVNDYSSEIKVSTFTATAGQTVFTLADQYVLGANTLEVLVNGATQIEGVDYTETSSSVFTFTSGLNAGDLVMARVLRVFPGTTTTGSLVGYQVSATGSVPRNVSSKLAESVSVKDFGAVGDGVTNDRAAFVLAFNSGFKSIFIPEGTYYMGEWTTSSRIIDLTGLGNGISILTAGNVRLTARTTVDGVTPYFFFLRNNSQFYCGPIQFQDLNYSYAAVRGAGGFNFDCIADDWGDIHIESSYCEDMISNVICSGATSSRVTGINIGTLTNKNCYYGFVAQNNGDSVNIGLINSDGCTRSYFVYGVTNHKVNVYTRNNLGTTGAVNISRSTGGYDTGNIEINYTSRENSIDIYHVNVNHIDTDGGTISGLKIHVDIRSDVAYDAVRFVNYGGSGTPEDTGTSSNYVYDIELSGSCDANARPIAVTAQYAAKRGMKFTPGRYFYMSQSLASKFTFGETARSITPTWTTTGTAPTIGNGSLVQSWDISGNLCTVTTSLTFGSTTSAGTGDWYFSLPFTAGADAVGSAYIRDAGVGYFVAACKTVSGGSTFNIYPDNASTAVRSNTPFIWTTSDSIIMTLTYPIA